MVSKTYEICNAYESGYGHGYNGDGKRDNYFTDDQLNEAYKIGYDAGFKELQKEKPGFQKITKRAWDACFNIYNDYRKDKILNFPTSIQEAWDIGQEMEKLGYVTKE